MNREIRPPSAAALRRALPNLKRTPYVESYNLTRSWAGFHLSRID